MFTVCFDCIKMFYNGFNKYTIPYQRRLSMTLMFLDLPLEGYCLWGKNKNTLYFGIAATR